MPPLSYSQLLAATLEGAWRVEPSRAGISADELAKVAPLLVGSGAAALAWWKIRRTGLAETPAARELREAYRYRTLRAAIQEREIETVFALLESARVEAVLVKGWASARAYPEQALRPFGDVDVWVRAEQLEDARRALEVPDAARIQVDLHEHFDEMDVRDFDTLYARGETVRIGRTNVRLLAPEDHLRLQCVHMLRHGAWRPLWLCDIAAAIESRADGFDWSRIFEGDGRRARWVACCAGLAHRLVGANVEGTPFHSEARRLPGWLVPGVLRQWENPYPQAHESPPVMRRYFRNPSGVIGALRRRWPDPIRATVYFSGSFNEFPRLPFQLGKFAAQSARYLFRLPAELRQGA